MRRRALVILGVVLGLLSMAGIAFASWAAVGSGSAYSKARILPSGNTPSTSVSGSNVTVTWSQVTFAGSNLGAVTGGGYIVKRYATGGGGAITPNANCDSTIAGATALLSCIENGVPNGSWQYTVTPALNNWRGSESTKSSTVTVASDVTAPALTTLEAFDNDHNGKIDHVVATFDENLATPYTAPNSVWTLTNVPSLGSLASVSVSTNQATLTLNEGTGAADTSVGAGASAFKVALAANANGIRDAAGNQSSFAATSVADKAPPARVSMFMQDTGGIAGKVDHVAITFSEALASYTAGNTPWTLSGVPSGGSLSSVSVATPVVTLNLTEGASPADTSVGSFTIAMTASATGVRDAAGNLASFAATAPTDQAKPVVVSITDTNGTTDGMIQAGDTLVVTFSEALAPASMPTSVTVSETDPPGSGNDTLSITGITTASDTGSDLYITGNNKTAGFASSTAALSNGNKTITVTVAGACTGTGCASDIAAGGPGTLVLGPVSTLTDPAGNGATGTFSVASFKIF